MSVFSVSVVWFLYLIKKAAHKRKTEEREKERERGRKEKHIKEGRRRKAARTRKGIRITTYKKKKVDGNVPPRKTEQVKKYATADTAGMSSIIGIEKIRKNC